MGFNVFEVATLSKIFDQQYKGRILTDVFSTSSDELFLDFSGDLLKISFLAGEVYFQTPDWEKRPKRNRLSQFGDLLNHKLKEVTNVPLDRIIRWVFEGGQEMVIRMFGRFCQISIYDDSELQAQFPAKARSYDSSDYTLEETSNPQDIQDRFAWLGETAVTFLQTGVAAGRSLNDLAKEFTEQNQALGFEIREHNGSWQLHESSKSGGLEVLHEYASKQLSHVHLETARRHLLSACENTIKQLKGKLNKQKKALASLENSLGYRHQADLLMANLHAIETGVKQVELLDFDGQQQVKIKLNPQLTPQANAERLYSKSKKENLRKEFVVRRMDELNQALISAEEERNSIQNSQDRKQLLKQHKNEASKTQTVRLPYTKVDIEGFEVRIGRSAKDNDELLRAYSSSHDLWFHAYKVGGSHVILRLGKGQQVDQRIIEKAAAFAAYNSKARPEALARVIYTYRKFVRKPRKANPGAVLVQHEKSILVDPTEGHQ